MVKTHAWNFQTLKTKQNKTKPIWDSILPQSEWIQREQMTQRLGRMWGKGTPYLPVVEVETQRYTKD